MKKLLYLALLPLLFTACENSLDPKPLYGWVWTESVNGSLEYGRITPDSALIRCALHLNDDGTYSAEVHGNTAYASEYQMYWNSTLNRLLVNGEVMAEGTYTTGSAPCDTNRCDIPDHEKNPEAYMVDSIVFYNTALNDTTVYYYELRDGEMAISQAYHNAIGGWTHIFNFVPENN